jgi:hypothetical protein
VEYLILILAWPSLEPEEKTGKEKFFGCKMP